MIPSAFDAAAATYDQEFTDSSVGRAQRRLVWFHLARVLSQLPAPAEVLEVNCGTGEDALWLAKQGHRVLATDISASMLVVAAQKAAQGGYRHAVTCARLAAQEIEPDTLGRRFDLVLSNFGGLNCLSPTDMRTLARRLPEMVSPGGRVLMVIMPPFCLWETFWSLITLRPGLAMRRWRKGPVMTQVHGTSFPIWYYRLGWLRRLFSDSFDCVRVRPVGFTVPPSALEGRLHKYPRLLSAMERIDRAFGRSSLLAAMSDHALLEFRRR